MKNNKNDHIQKQKATVRVFSSDMLSDVNQKYSTMTLNSKLVKQCNTGVNYLTGRMNTNIDDLSTSKQSTRPVTAIQR